MKKVDVVLGLQWGDEGKGKIVDVLASRYKAVARFQGGPNAGHSICIGDSSFVLHSVPSGIFRADTVNFIGNGVVVDPVILMEEIRGIEAAGVKVEGRLLIAKRANLILPTHRVLDATNEAHKGKGKIGSTLKGIGPAYTDKIARTGLRVGDIASADFRSKYEALRDWHLIQIEALGYKDFDISEYEAKWFEAARELLRFDIIDNEVAVNRCLADDVAILAEGAQGSLLDIDFGTYPFVTSSNTLCAGACTGLGVAPSRIGEVFGIFKAYCTRVGSGPFPTELFDETGETMRRIGHEYGATTGRSRRCGWLDLVALNYAVMMNGATSLIMMKADVMNDFDTIKVCVGYELDGKPVHHFPYEAGDADIKPVYKEFPGWKCDISGVRSYDALPQQLKDYIGFIEDFTGVRIDIVSVGPDRDQTIER